SGGWPQQQQQQQQMNMAPPPIVAVARDGGGSSGFSDAMGVIRVPKKSNAPIFILLGAIVLGISVAAFALRSHFHLQSIPVPSVSASESAVPSASALTTTTPTTTPTTDSTITAQPPPTASAEPTPSASAAPTATTAPTETTTPTTTSEAPHPSASAAPRPTAAPVDPNAFDAAAANHSLATSDSILVSCSNAKGQKGVAHVTFGSDGAVQKVTVDPPLAGTPGGDCVASRYKFAHAPKFVGAPVTVDHAFHVPK
ncbi:MAG: hypothetical protein ABI183_19270, partial [Polyangiaceae bacterium]